MGEALKQKHVRQLRLGLLQVHSVQNDNTEFKISAL